MVVHNTTEFYRAMLEKYQMHFEQNCSPSFGNLLWQLIINEVMDNKIICFHPAMTKSGWQIGIVHNNESGYQPTHVHFADVTARDYDRMIDICTEMNLDIFGLSDDVQFKMTCRSMSIATTAPESIQSKSNS